MHHDFGAFRRRLLTAAIMNTRYETRAAPEDDSGIQLLTETLQQVTTSVTDFKRKHSTELDSLKTTLSEQGGTINEIKRGLDKIETKLARPGAGGNAAATAPDSKLGGDLEILRTSEDFERHYEKRHREHLRGTSSPNEAEATTLADFARGVAGIRTTESVKASLAVGTDTAGGYAVPDIVMPGIFAAMAPESSLMLAGAGFVQLEEGAKSARTVITDTLPVAAWREELGNVAEANPTFRGVEAVPKSLACVIRISRELLADGVGMDQALRLAIGQGFAKEIDRVGLRGSGTSPEPRGLLNTADVNAVTQGANGTALANYAPVLAGMLAVRNENGPMPTTAIMAPRSTFKLAGLVDTTGQPIQKPEMLQRLRIHDTSQIPVNLTVGTSNDCSEIYVGDFTRMYFLIRENVSIQLLREAYAKTGEIGFLCHARIDVVIPYPKAFAIVTGVKA